MKLCCRAKIYLVNNDSSSDPFKKTTYNNKIQTISPLLLLIRINSI